jgi:DNA-binding HxlR family transcriptional regulator
MKFTPLDEMECSIARTLNVVGEWWTLLIVRDALRGATRFEEFQASLGIARNVLSARLRRLVDNGIMQRQPYQQRPVRYEYRLTERGRDLFPVIAEMMRWGDTWAAGPAGPPVLLRHETCGSTIQPALTCPHCHGELTVDNTRPEPPRPR